MYIDIDPYFTDGAEDFTRHIKGEFEEWYVGLTADPKHNLLTVHRVDMIAKNWILSNQCTPQVLSDVKKRLVSMGCKNSDDLDMDDPNRVYLYQIKQNTREEK
ncbi:MAG: hypothetical protein GY714_17630 [Desulfobacterales bacterium]|nr:hypothetical protein [Desulfobacterales bacterium]MCP4162891.1 hypothetical protein [Deltaproteobacteria bacterium]